MSKHELCPDAVEFARKLTKEKPELANWLNSIGGPRSKRESRRLGCSTNTQNLGV